VVTDHENKKYLDLPQLKNLFDSTLGPEGVQQLANFACSVRNKIYRCVLFLRSCFMIFSKYQEAIHYFYGDVYNDLFEFCIDEATTI